MPPQFSSYDPVVIRSHAGVRSDLFRRPLDKTLITDFFGGVAQAEMFPPVPDGAQNVFSEDICPPETSQQVAISPEDDLKHLDRARENTILPSVVGESEPWDTRWKEIRKWTSILLVGSLVAWVSFAG